MAITTSVQTLINQFELMAQVNVVSSAPQSRSVSKFKKMPLPKADNVRKFIERLNTQHSRTQLKPVQMIQNAEEALEPVEELLREEVDAPIGPSMKATVYKGLTVSTSDKYDATIYDSSFTSMIPRSPSTYSTASTCSLDSLLTSLDPHLPDLLQMPGEASDKVVVNRLRQPASHENLQLTTTSKLILPTSYRRSLLGKPPSTTAKESPISAPKSRRCSLKSARVVVVSPARTRANPSSSPRYMNYDSSPRYAATKAWNLKRRRQLEERNRNLRLSS